MILSRCATDQCIDISHCWRARRAPGSSVAAHRTRPLAARRATQRRAARLYAVRSATTTPNGLKTLVAKRPSQRARMRFLLKSSALLFSDHCTPTPLRVCVDCDCALREYETRTRCCADCRHDGHPEQASRRRIVRQAQCSTAFVDATARARRPPNHWGATQLTRRVAVRFELRDALAQRLQALTSNTPVSECPTCALMSATIFASTATPSP